MSVNPMKINPGVDFEKALRGALRHAVNVTSVDAAAGLADYLLAEKLINPVLAYLRGQTDVQIFGAMTQMERDRIGIGSREQQAEDVEYAKARMSPALVEDEPSRLQELLGEVYQVLTYLSDEVPDEEAGRVRTAVLKASEGDAFEMIGLPFPRELGAVRQPLRRE